MEKQLAEGGLRDSETAANCCGLQYTKQHLVRTDGFCYSFIHIAPSH